MRGSVDDERTSSKGGRVRSRGWLVLLHHVRHRDRLTSLSRPAALLQRELIPLSQAGWLRPPTPWGVIRPVAGPVSDRHDRRRVISTTGRLPFSHPRLRDRPEPEHGRGPVPGRRECSLPQLPRSGLIPVTVPGHPSSRSLATQLRTGGGAGCRRADRLLPADQRLAAAVLRGQEPPPDRSLV